MKSNLEYEIEVLLFLHFFSIFFFKIKQKFSSFFVFNFNLKKERKKMLLIGFILFSLKPKLHIYDKLFTQNENENYSTFLELSPGTYFIQVWGASSMEKSLGGYSEGFLTLLNDLPIYIQLGGRGTCYQQGIGYAEGGRNGGGAAFTQEYQKICGAGGGTDIRAFQNSLYYRFIVAGGAGTSAANAFGGGESGGTVPNVYRGKGGTQIHPGSKCYAGEGCVAGTFGIGGTRAPVNAGGGGGGGWFGGASGGNNKNRWYAGGGGSGYVLTKRSYQPDWYPLKGVEKLFMYRAKTIGGNLTFPAPKGGTEIGHFGDGCARIVFIHNRSTPYNFVFIIIIALTTVKIRPKNLKHLSSAQQNQGSENLTNYKYAQFYNEPSPDQSYMF